MIAASIFPSERDKLALQSAGIETIDCDFLDQAQLDALPDAPNVVFMVGMKFGSVGAEALTWAINVYLPGMVAQRYRSSRIVAFSSGNIYKFVPSNSGGSAEADTVGAHRRLCHERSWPRAHLRTLQQDPWHRP